MIIYTTTDVDIDVKDELGISGAVVKALLALIWIQGTFYIKTIGIVLAFHTLSSCTNRRLTAVAVRKIRKGMQHSAQNLAKGVCEKRQSDPLLLEWNVEFRPKAKHWDPLGHSVPS